jgi:hypothetical protein
MFMPAVEAIARLLIVERRVGTAVAASKRLSNG